MKKNILIIAALFAAASTFAQGTIAFNNIVTGQVRAPIYGPDPANPTLIKQGNPSSGTPAGTTVYGGSLLAGTGFSVQVWGGSTSASEAQLLASSVVLDFRTGSASGFVNNAAGVSATIAGVAEGQQANVQLRAWDNLGGTVTTWDQAVALGAARGASAIFVSQPLGGILTTSPNMVGLTSFNIAAVPEPSTIALGVLGAGSLLFLRRKK